MTKSRLLGSAVLLSFAFGMCELVVGQEEHTPDEGPALNQQVAPTYQPAQPAIFTPQGNVITPASSVVRPEDAGLYAHTNYHIFVPSGSQMSDPTPSFTFAETPASMGCVYRVGPVYAGCNPATGGTNHPTGGWGAIALVDAYDNPRAAADLATFSAHFGLPAANFVKVYANSSFGVLNGMTASCSGTPPGNTWLGP